MSANWIEREEESIDRDYEDGLISSEEAARARRDLADEIRAEAEEAAESAFRDHMGYF
jgi:hypothetical protein